MDKDVINQKIEIFKKEILPLVVSAETSNDPANWSIQNPLKGHCAVVSLFLHNAIGAEIIRCAPILPDGTKDSHYLNKVEGEHKDLTGEQYDVYEYGGGQVYFSDFQTRTAEYLLSNENTKKRYEIFERKAVAVMQQKKFSFAA